MLISSTDRLLIKDVELKHYSNWKIGGKSDYFGEPGNSEDLKKMLQFASENGLPVQIIGNATNILFDDEGFRGLIIKIGNGFKRIKAEHEKVVAEAGIWAPCLARSLASMGYAGLEHIVGIPGTLGGLVIMNGGSKRKCISTNILRVHVIDYNGNQHIIDKESCEFSYRSSIFQKMNWIVQKVELHLAKGNPQMIRQEMLAILESRRKKFPLKLPNCGSTFISDPVLFKTHGSPGKINEDLGLKGYVRGGAKISEQHANFIVNMGNASSNDVIEIARHCRLKVHESTGKWIRSEIRYLKPIGGLEFLHTIL